MKTLKNSLNKKCDYFQLGYYTSNKSNKNKFIFKKFMKNCNNGMIIIFSGRTAQSFKYEIKNLPLRLIAKISLYSYLVKK